MKHRASSRPDVCACCGCWKQLEAACWEAADADEGVDDQALLLLHLGDGGQVHPVTTPTAVGQTAGGLSARRAGREDGLQVPSKYLA